ncbi:MAG: hypothetical protein WCO98_05460 [bacterium]
MKEMVDGLTLSNGVHIQLLGKEYFAGLGKVTLGDTVLRSGRRPMFVEIRNPDGITMGNYRLENIVRKDDSIVMSFNMESAKGGIMDWMVHTVRNRYNTADWTEAPIAADDTMLKLIIRPVTRKIDGRTFTGFSYQYHYTSASIAVYRILDRGTWEVGGQAVGNEFWMRNCFTPSIVPITSIDQFHSTEWYLPSCTNPSIFQFLPLQTELQGFSFVSAAQGTLATWATEVAHVRSLFEKQRGKDEIVHLHEHCGDLSNNFITSPVEMLFTPGQQDNVGRANIYESIRELVHETLHTKINMRRERITTYGQIEEWGNADMEYYRKSGLPKLIKAGVKTIGMPSHFENNMNVWGVSNMCCTVDYKVAESVGKDKLAAFCKDAHAAGINVEMWANTSISSLTEIFNRKSGRPDRIKFLPREGSIMEALDKVPGAFVRNPSNAIEADHYTPEFCVLNLREQAVRKYWLTRWKEAHDEVGLDGIFLDSSFNLSSDKFHFVQKADAETAGGTADQTHLLGHYRPAIESPKEILSQYRAHLILMKEMQDIGYVYDNEDLGVFGIHRHGPDITARLNSMSIWSDCICGMNAKDLRAINVDPEEIFFKGMAYRMMYTINWNIDQDALCFSYYGGDDDKDKPNDWHFQQVRIYNEVNQYMLKRTILPGEKAVQYIGAGKQVLWVFEDFDYTADGKIKDMTTGEELPAGKIGLKKMHVYLKSE